MKVGVAEGVGEGVLVKVGDGVLDGVAEGVLVSVGVTMIDGVVVTPGPVTSTNT